ncbi:MAG TPA: DUF4912 domain-containing protein [Chthoniobacterales bacterium]|jgi:hypothetical protein
MGNDPITSEPGNTGESPVSESAQENAQPFKISAEPQIASRVVTPDPVEEIPQLPIEEPVLSTSGSESSFDDLGELPASYQTGQVYLAARDPHWLFVYWDLDLESYDRDLMSQGEPNFYLKVFTTRGDMTDQIRVNTHAKNWYFPIKDAGLSYFVELGFHDTRSEWAVLGTSNVAFAPADTFNEGPAEFASVPFHLSFHRMLELVQGEMESGTSLIGSFARLQGNVSRNLQEIAGNWTEEQRKLLEALVGADLVSQISLGSAEIDQIFRQRLSESLSETLSSPSSSEVNFLQGLVGPTWTESSLSSGIGASWTGETSWMQAVGGEASWSGALGSSWSAQPFGGAGRDFFMHVNAEVIFYGGTHPDATVWIDGKEIQLAQDGSFRYHFRLPDGEFEIPIVAESPDGVEIRSAKLVFKRGTSRTGDVGATSQPSYLNAPMGAR